MNPAQTEPQQTQAFEFTGKGGEYFRIWIVNLALTILTLGIYSAWAKVRRLQYFYRNTSLHGGSFDYHGAPLAILKGRLIAVGLLVLYNVTLQVYWALGVIVFICLIAMLPWLIQRSLRFKLYYSSYRGVRFRFNGSTGGAYGAFLGWPILGYITAGILMPFAHQQIKSYQHRNSLFGTTQASFDADAGKFYVIYLKMIGMVLIPVILIAIFAGVTGAFGLLSGGEGSARDPEQMKRMTVLITVGVMVFYLAIFLLVGPWFAARIQNLVWNHTAIGPHQFISNVRARDLLGIYITNFIAIILTLGLFKPFADIRLMRYRLTHMALQAQGNLDEFCAQEQQAVTAMGEETADVFDVDISF